MRPRADGWPSRILALAVFAGAAVSTPAADELRFVRVNIPAESMRDMPLDGGRYVPMPLAEFDELVARLGAAVDGVRLPVASEARSTLSLDLAGTLAGSVEFELVGPADTLPSQVVLGKVVAGRCSVRTAEGTGEADVFCLPDGAVAIRTIGPATYRCDLRLAASVGSGPLWLPMVPALATTVELQLPKTIRPIVVSGAAAVVTPVNNDSGVWKIVSGPIGPGHGLAVLLWDGRRDPPPVRAWNAVTIRGRQAEVVARLDPGGDWTPDALRLDLPAAMRIIRAVSAADGEELSGSLTGRRPQLDIPPRLVGSRDALLVTGVVPLDLDGMAVVPVIQPAKARWGGTAVRVGVDSSLAVKRVELLQCRPRATAAAERWPLPDVPLPPGNAGIEPARLDLEFQSPAGEAAIALGDREASFDTARLTTVDISPGTVLGRTAVDLRVVAGQVFELAAEVAPGWFIDSVEAVDWERTDALADGVAVPDWSPEWRVVRSPRGSELRIGLPRAATPRRSPGLRITGHRSGLPLGAEFSSDDMDMLRFPGETAALEFQVGPTAVLEAVDGELGMEPLAERLTVLGGLAAPRARIRAGDRAPAVRARLVRRRPPVEADVTVELAVRDERLAETFTFTCRPVSGELDAVVIHFSEPMGPDLEWSLGTGGGTLAAQPLDPGDATRGELRAEPSVAESWLVQLRPATTTAVTFRGSRTVSLDSAAPVPLAWVEAAELPGGTVTIRGDAGRLPQLSNRLLRELPPVSESEPGILELAYGSPRMLGGGTAAEIAPPAATAAARAWAWSQTSTCWCHDSGDIEWQTGFEIENQGRETATLSLPAGLRTEGVIVAGETVIAAPTGAGQGGLAVPLPRASGRFELVVRGSGASDGRFGWWQIAGVACGIDMPVLDRALTLMLPPGLVLLSAPASAPDPGLAARLFGAWFPQPVGAEASTQGFRAVTIPRAKVGGDAGFLVMRRDLFRCLVVMVACLVGGAIFLLAGRRGSAALAACGMAAIAAVWCPSPWDMLARAAFQASILGIWVGALRRPGVRRVVLLLAVTLAAGGQPRAARAEELPLRVYVTTAGEEGTALVPEPLFRRLSGAAAAVAPPAVRVLASDIAADGERGIWRLALELDADRGGVLLLEQEPAGGSWRVPAALPENLVVTVDEARRTARVLATSPGRQQLELEVTSPLSREGDLEVAAIRIPPAPRATLRVESVDGIGPGSGWQCDRSDGPGPWLSAPRGSDGWEIAAASRVRLVRSAVPRASLQAALRAAVSYNDIGWRDDECRLTATFDVGAEGEIVRGLLVRAAPGLEPLPAAGSGPTPVPLGGGRYLLELSKPRAGQRRVTAQFRMPLADPVGVFEPPFAWLEAAETDVRTVRLRPAADLEAEVELPVGMSLVRPREEDGPETTAVWRSDAGGASDAGGPPDSGPRIAVRRRRAEPAVVQDLSVDFADDHVGLRLRCRFDATKEPLLEIPIDVPPAAVVDRLSLVRESVDDAAAKTRDRVDLIWSREAADRLVAVVQQPDTGRFWMRLDARLPIRPASRGRLPVARVGGNELPLELSWRAAAGTTVRLAASDGGKGPSTRRLELGPGEPGPAYRLSREQAAEPAASPRPAAAEPAVKEPVGGTFTAVDVSLDGLGRTWGLVWFDLITSETELTLALPGGLRLFGVRVDGHEVVTVPRAGNTWAIRLHDVSWPRSLVAVFAGSVGSRLSDGGAIKLEPPRLVGLPAGRVVWTLDTPRGYAIRVSEPGRILEPSAFAAVQAAERQRFDEALRVAVRRSDDVQRERLDAFAAARQAASRPAGERAWYEAGRTRDASGSGRQQTLVAAAGDGTVTFRALPVAGEAASGRGLATAVILLIGLACWTAARWLPDRWHWAGVVLHRWWWVACGAGWLAFSPSIVPGGAMLVVGIWLSLSRRALPAGPEAMPSEPAPAR